jgi:hypothetical protein
MAPIFYLDLIVNFIYLLDFLITLRTTFYNKDGEEVFDPWKIALNYLKTIMIPDILVCIPFQLFIASPLIKVIQILKVTRIPRLSSIINRLDMRDDQKAIFAILAMTIYLFVYINITTCLWYYLISIEKTWLPFKDTGLIHDDYWECSTAYKYFYSMYYMVIVMGGNETGPSNVMLKLWTTANIVVGNLYMANVMGSMADLVQVIARRDIMF